MERLFRVTGSFSRRRSSQALRGVTSVGSFRGAHVVAGRAAPCSIIGAAVAAVTDPKAGTTLSEFGPLLGKSARPGHLARDTSAQSDVSSCMLTICATDSCSSHPSFTTTVCHAIGDHVSHISCAATFRVTSFQAPIVPNVVQRAPCFPVLSLSLSSSLISFSSHLCLSLLISCFRCLSLFSLSPLYCLSLISDFFYYLFERRSVREKSEFLTPIPATVAPLPTPASLLTARRWGSAATAIGGISDAACELGPAGHKQPDELPAPG